MCAASRKLSGTSYSSLRSIMTNSRTVVSKILEVGFDVEKLHWGDPLSILWKVSSCRSFEYKLEDIISRGENGPRRDQRWEFVCASWIVLHHSMSHHQLYRRKDKARFGRLWKCRCEGRRSLKVSLYLFSWSWKKNILNMKAGQRSLDRRSYIKSSSLHQLFEMLACLSFQSKYVKQSEKKIFKGNRNRISNKEFDLMSWLEDYLKRHISVSAKYWSLSELW